MSAEEALRAGRSGAPGQTMNQSRILARRAIHLRPGQWSGIWNAMLRRDQKTSNLAQKKKVTERTRDASFEI